MWLMIILLSGLVTCVLITALMWITVHPGKHIIVVFSKKRCLNESRYCRRRVCCNLRCLIVLYCGHMAVFGVHQNGLIGYLAVLILLLSKSAICLGMLEHALQGSLTLLWHMDCVVECIT